MVTVYSNYSFFAYVVDNPGHLLDVPVKFSRELHHFFLRPKKRIDLGGAILK